MDNHFTSDMRLRKGTKLFLDRKSCQNTAKIENVLKKMGIIVDEFLSKEVDYIIADNISSNSNQQNHPDKFIFQEGVQRSLLSRSQALLMRSNSVNSPSSLVRADPVHFAQKFNIPLVTTSDLKKILHSKMVGIKNSKKNNHLKDLHLLNLESNFIKVEDCSRCFIPLFKKFLGIYAKDITSSKFINKLPKKNLPKENLEYCECCDEICDDLSMHRKGKSHISFVTNNKNFLSIDELMGNLLSLNDLKNMHGGADGILLVDSANILNVAVEEGTQVTTAAPQYLQKNVHINEGATDKSPDCSVIQQQGVSTPQTNISNTNSKCLKMENNCISTLPEMTSFNQREIKNNACYDIPNSCENLQCDHNLPFITSPGMQARTKSVYSTTNAGSKCLSLNKIQYNAHLPKIYFTTEAQDHFSCIVKSRQFQGCDVFPKRQPSNALYTCRPMMSWNVADDEPKLIITNANSQCVVDVLMQRISNENICYKALPHKRHTRPLHQSYKAKDMTDFRQNVKSVGCDFSSVCHDLQQDVYCSANEGAHQGKFRRWATPRRRYKKDRPVVNKLESLYEKNVNYSADNVQEVNMSCFKSTNGDHCYDVKAFPKNHDHQTHKCYSQVSGDGNFWTLKYVTGLKVVLTRLRSSQC